MKRICFLILLATGAVLPRPLAAQELNLDYLPRVEAWRGSENAAGLHLLPARDASVARLFLDKEDGQLVNYHQSPDSRAWGARVASVARLHRRVSLAGEIVYDYFKGKDMGGSTFIDPSRAPFNIVEYADTNRGTKSLERYTLSGALAADLHRGLVAGARVHYKAANHSKHKDLRHKNTLLDLSLSAGLAARVARGVEVGANYFHRRSIEGIGFSVYGNTDRQYLSLVSFGAFLGRRELFGDSGYTSESRPLVDAHHGAAVQINLSRRRLALFQEFSYRARSGYFGEKSTTAIRYSDHEGTTLSYRAHLSLRAPRATHLLELLASRETLENQENIYRAETTPGQTTVIVYYGQAKMLERSDTRLAATYTGLLGHVAGHPAWSWHASVDHASRALTVSFYPFFRLQNLRTFASHVGASRHLPLGTRTLGLALDLGASTGSGVPARDGLYATPSANQPAPRTADHLLHREHEYLTLPRGSLTATLSLDHPVTPSARAFARLSSTFRRTFRPVHYLLSRSSRALSISLGCYF
jgi:hypothetical protein